MYKAVPQGFLFNSEDYISNYETLISKCKLPTLKLRGMRTMTLEIHKLIRKQDPSYIHDFICVKNNNLILDAKIQHQIWHKVFSPQSAERNLLPSILETRGVLNNLKGW